MLKRWTTLFLALALAVILAACGKTTDPAQSSNATTKPVEGLAIEGQPKQEAVLSGSKYDLELPKVENGNNPKIAQYYNDMAQRWAWVGNLSEESGGGGAQQEVRVRWQTVQQGELTSVNVYLWDNQLAELAENTELVGDGVDGLVFDAAGNIYTAEEIAATRGLSLAKLSEMEQAGTESGALPMAGDAASPMTEKNTTLLLYGEDALLVSAYVRGPIFPVLFVVEDGKVRGVEMSAIFSEQGLK
ncbi:MAG: hypothetical protein LBG83_07115 [Oscillospiraceae bacterium]|nr:hypothetical protein [Oscillospiraceae bacterium]